MDDAGSKRLGAAVRAAWCTIIIWGVWMTAAWFGWLGIMHARPGWMLTLWGGGDLTWAEVQTVTIWFFGAIKIVLLVAVMGSIWLTLYARRLKRG